MFSARLVGRLARFHGQRSETSSGRPSAVNQPRTGQLPGRLGDRADPGARDVLDRLAEHAAGGAAEPGARDPLRQVVRLLPPGRIGRGEDLVEAVRLRRRERPRQRVELVEQLERERAQLRRDRLLGGAAARRRRAAGGEPALLDVVDVLPFLAGLPELVPDEVLGLDPGHPLKQAPRRP